MPHGINICGPLTATNGIGEALRGFVRAVQLSGVRYALNDLQHDAQTLRRQCAGFVGNNPYGLSCLYFNPNAISERWWPPYAAAYLRDRHNVGFWYWEADRLRPSWRACAHYFDEIWTGSDFCRRIFESELQMPVAMIPPVVEVAAEQVEEPLPIFPGLFVVLCCYDYHSCVQRKNPEAVVRAFRQAFARQNDVRLVLKARTSGLKRRLARQHRRLRRLVQGFWPFWSGDRRIVLLGDDLSREQMCGLLRRCDCLVSLHRSEGFGLHLAEAMCLGIPVIGTGYSGNLDFMREDNSYLVGYELRQVPRGAGPYPPGSCWAEPDVGHAAELLRHVYSHRDEAREKARRGAAFIRQQHSPDRVGQILRERLASVWGSTAPNSLGVPGPLSRSFGGRTAAI